MKLSWLFIILLLVFVALFSVQNAEPIAVRFLAWNVTMSAALVIQLAALLGGLVGLAAGASMRRAPAKSAQAKPDISAPAQAEKAPGIPRNLPAAS